MAYQIPSKAQALFLLENTKIQLFTILPQQDLLFKHTTVTMFIRGHIGSDFKMRLNVYADAVGGKLLMSSTPINNLDISRTDDLYTELRFDFEKLGNVMSVGKKHLVEFEIYDGYVYGHDDYVAIIYDYFAAQNYMGTPEYLVDPADGAELCAKCSLFFDKKNDSTEKFQMCRIQGAKLLNGIASETEYQFFPARKLYTATIQPGLHPSSLKVFYTNFGNDDEYNMAQLTEDFTPDPLALDENLNCYYYNPANGELKLYTEYSFNTTTFAIFEYFMFFTDTRGKYAPYNMESGFKTVYWHPRLPANLDFDFSQQNNLQGLLSISASAISLKNQDKYFNDFFSLFDCFNNREVKVWSCEGSVSNKKVDFVGLIRGVDVTDDACTFSLADPLARLDDLYQDGKAKTVGDLSSIGGYPIKIVDTDRIVPRVLGKISSFSLLYKNAGDINITWMDKANMIECIDVSYVPAFGTANNRVWSCGFGPASAATMQRDVSAHGTEIVSGVDVSKFTIDNTDGPVSEWLPPGTCIENNGNYGIVYASNDTEAYVWPTNAGYSAAADIIRHKVISVIVQQGSATHYLKAGEAYTCQIGAAGDLQIVLANNFEALASVAMASTLDPHEDKIYACFMNDEADARASQIVRNVLLGLGMSINGQFEPAQPPTWNDPNLAITIPFPGSNDMPQARQVVELALKSAMSCLYFDDGGLIRYKSFLQPIESVLANVDNQSEFDPEDEINQNNSTEFSVSFDLWDLYGGADFIFNHCKMYYQWRIEKDMVKYFYKTQKLYQVEVALDPTSTDVAEFLDDYANLVMGRSAVVSLRALSDQSNLWIGDDIQVTRDKLIADDNTQTLRVIAKSKSITGARLSLMDLKKFPGL